MVMKKTELSKLRIIGGKWRGRKIIFAPDAATALRPTPNRVKETIFNWLASVIQDANCLDAFAGSGSLGFEALSRGAKHVVMIDQSSEVVKILKQNAETLHAENLQIIQGNFPEILKGKTFPKFDIVFLDPPFHQQLVEPAGQWLEGNNFLANEAYISAEVEYELPPEKLPKNWEIIRCKKAGQVYYHLIKRIRELE